MAWKIKLVLAACLYLRSYFIYKSLNIPDKSTYNKSWLLRVRLKQQLTFVKVKFVVWK